MSRDTAFIEICGMDCQKFRKVVFLYCDDEMGEELRVDFQEHLALCPGCAQRIAFTRRVLAVVRERCERASAPARLRVRILGSLPHRRL